MALIHWLPTTNGCSIIRIHSLDLPVMGQSLFCYATQEFIICMSRQSLCSSPGIQVCSFRGLLHLEKVWNGVIERALTYSSINHDGWFGGLGSFYSVMAPVIMLMASKQGSQQALPGKIKIKNWKANNSSSVLVHPTSLVLRDQNIPRIFWIPPDSWILK